MARSSAATATGAQRHTLGIALLLCVATGVVYAPVLDFPFVDLDDTAYVTDNPRVQARPDACETSAGRSPPSGQLQLASADVAVARARLSSSSASTAGHHLTNILLHVGERVCSSPRCCAARPGAGRSAFVAALFALHPLHVESVAWVAERKDVLSAFFWSLAIGCACVHGRRTVVGRRYASSCVALFALGLMAKPMLVTLPCRAAAPRRLAAAAC